jgi:hypothetical protein
MSKHNPDAESIGIVAVIAKTATNKDLNFHPNYGPRTLEKKSLENK